MDEKHPKDPFQNYIVRYPQSLDAVFKPKTIAVIGAKDTLGSVGRTIMLNLTQNHFTGTVYPINPKRSEVLGLKAYPSLNELPEQVDLAIIVTPAKTVPGIVSECVDAHVKAAVIISAGFKELGAPGVALEEEILRIAARGNMRIIGPNCLGVMNTMNGLNATFAKGMALPGNLAFISQSGAMCTAVLDWSHQESIGFSAFISIGSMADVDFGDLIGYLADDPNTSSILIYMETIGNPRNFLSAARAIALEKPIIVIKPGRSQEAAKAAASHTGSLSGSDDVFDAAMERAGVMRVDTIAELFNLASVLSKQPKPKGSKLSIVTNAGGPSVLATDAAITHGASLSRLSDDTILEMNQFLPAAWSHGNPVDILGDADTERYVKTMQTLSHDKNVDGVLVILSPQDMTDPIGVADGLRNYARMKDKPVLASWMGGVYVQKGVEILNQAGIPTFNYPDDAAASFAAMWRYTKNLQALFETPYRLESGNESDQAKCFCQKLIKQMYAEKRTLLSEYESKQLLNAYRIPTIETLKAETVNEAIAHAEKLGFPVVLKLHSHTVTHKSDVGGVQLNLQSAEEVRQAFERIEQGLLKKYSQKDFQGVTVQRMAAHSGLELILGASVDPQFGPIILFGAGGVFVEIFKDRALALPPLNATLARLLIDKTKISHVLDGFRGARPIDKEALIELVVQFAQMVIENRRIAECDINPLLASPDGIIALDARIVLYPEETPDDEIPKSAIRPYPVRYMKQIKLSDGTSICLRPIKPEDEVAMVAFHKTLSESNVRQYYFEFVSLDARTAHNRLVRICFTDFDREITLVADDDGVIAGVARLSREPKGDSAELKLTVSDPYQNKGIGTELLHHLLETAKNEGVKTITATILAENSGMINLCKKAGFTLELKGEVYQARRAL